jgi:hypothetical protein
MSRRVALEAAISSTAFDFEQIGRQAARAAMEGTLARRFITPVFTPGVTT